MDEEIDLIGVWKKDHLEDLLARKGWDKVKKTDLPISVQKFMKFAEEVRDGNVEIKVDGNGNPVWGKFEGRIVYFQDVN